MKQSQPILISLVLGVSLLSVAACQRKEAPQAVSVAEDPAAMVKRENREIAERLAKEKEGLEQKNAQARVVFEADNAKEARQKNAAQFREKRSKWDAPFAEAGRTLRPEIGGVITKLEAVKQEVQSTKLDDCHDKATSTLTTAMGQVIDAYKEFQTGTGQPSDTVKNKLTDANTGFARADAEARDCAQQ